MKYSIRDLGWAALLGVLCAGGCSKEPDRLNSIRQVQAVSGEYLGDWLAGRHAGERVVVLTPPQIEGMPKVSTGNETLIDHLVDRLEKNGLSVRRHEVTSSLPDGSPHSEPDDQQRMLVEQANFLSPPDLTAVSKKLTGSADVILVPQPCIAPIRYTELPPFGSGPVLVLLGSWVIDDPEAAVEKTTVEAILQLRPRHSVPLDESEPTSPEDVFNRHYELIH